jgi:hypothetical protein
MLQIAITNLTIKKKHHSGNESHTKSPIGLINVHCLRHYLRPNHCLRQSAYQLQQIIPVKPFRFTTFRYRTLIKQFTHDHFE